MKLILGDSLQKLKDLPTSTIDAVVTDPPYGLSFMGKQWDYDVPTIDLWAEVFRVLKPGGHVLSFFGTRTYHAGVIRMEAAGFEIRDMLQWLYGSGFPKSLDVSKAIDKAAGAEREVVGVDKTKLRPNKERFAKVVAENTRHGIAGVKDNGATITAPATDDAKRWQGWGTALKPANEPIVLARKPLEKGLTVAQNVLKWGTGALAIDASRIGYASDSDKKSAIPGDGSLASSIYGGCELATKKQAWVQPAQGRWPANVLFDETAAAMLDGQSGFLAPSGNKAKSEGTEIFGSKVKTRTIPGVNSYSAEGGGGASRFFYVAKASKRERNAGLEGMPEKDRPLAISQWEGQTNGSGEVMGPSKPQANHHPTVKPIKLMEYLCKLVTPPGGIVLDPFMGSGTTGCAAVKLGYQFIGIEREAEYIEIAKRRIEHWRTQASEQAPDDDQLPLPLEPA